MNEWDELFEYMEEHKDDPILESCGDDKVLDTLLDESVLGRWIKEHPKEYAVYLLQSTWDLRLPKWLRDKASGLLLSLKYEGHR